MKFDYVIGNPPYQDIPSGDNDFAKPVYNEFMDAAYTVSDRVELIHPARFLFNAGSTPRNWNEKMLKDKHFKVLKYELNSKEIFNGQDIKGGIAVTYRDATKDFGAINVFTSFSELESIMRKVNTSEGNSLMNIIYVQNRYNLELLLKEHPECKSEISSNGTDRRFRNNAFDRVSIFTEKESEESIKVIGVIKNKRVWRYIPIKYTDMSHENINKYKVLVPAANGTGALGEVLSTPLIGTPLIGYTQTFIGIGSFDNENEAENCFKYVKSKFCRTMLGVLKITQTNNKETWRYVPLQNFSNNSDIDWNASIHNIDEQLYRKYNFTQEEIDFIETHVKEME